ncbi:DUF2963 domain-containing protein [Candidatus Phytoplasma solani]|uniref:DUF2963 domain-containing protein n=1 Tax=Candidatus Phytoplasma solani TaxID=69896 RepID=UPI00358ECC86
MHLRKKRFFKIIKLSLLSFFISFLLLHNNIFADSNERDNSEATPPSAIQSGEGNNVKDGVEKEKKEGTSTEGQTIPIEKDKASQNKTLSELSTKFTITQLDDLDAKKQELNNKIIDKVLEKNLNLSNVDKTKFEIQPVDSTLRNSKIKVKHQDFTGEVIVTFTKITVRRNNETIESIIEFNEVTGNAVKTTWFKPDGTPQTIKFIAEFDQATGNVFKATIYQSDGKKIDFIKEFDSNTEDNLVKEIYYQEDGTTIDCVVEFDQATGNVFKATIYQSDGKKIDFIKEFDSNTEDNLVKEIYYQEDGTTLDSIIEFDPQTETPIRTTHYKDNGEFDFVEDHGLTPQEQTNSSNLELVETTTLLNILTNKNTITIDEENTEKAKAAILVNNPSLENDKTLNVEFVEGQNFVVVSSRTNSGEVEVPYQIASPPTSGTNTLTDEKPKENQTPTTQETQLVQPTSGTNTSTPTPTTQETQLVQPTSGTNTSTPTPTTQAENSSLIWLWWTLVIILTLLNLGFGYYYFQKVKKS